MALNQLAPVPDSLSGIREARREAGKTGSGGSEFQRVTHTETGRTDETKGTWEEGKGKREPLSHVVQQVTSPKPISQTTIEQWGRGKAWGLTTLIPME